MVLQISALRLAAIALLAAVICLSGIDGTEAQAQSASDAASVSSAPEAMDLYVVLMKKIASAVDNVKDEATADAAARTINETSQTMEILANRAKNQITPHEWMAVTAARQQEFVEIQNRMSNAFMRLAQTNPSLLERISDAMQDLPSVGE